MKGEKNLSIRKINKVKKSSVALKDKRNNSRLNKEQNKQIKANIKPPLYNKERAFYLIKIIGQGAFANVYLAQSRQSG